MFLWNYADFSFRVAIDQAKIEVSDWIHTVQPRSTNAAGYGLQPVWLNFRSVSNYVMWSADLGPEAHKHTRTHPHTVALLLGFGRLSTLLPSLFFFPFHSQLFTSVKTQLISGSQSGDSVLLYCSQSYSHTHTHIECVCIQVEQRILLSCNTFTLICLQLDRIESSWLSSQCDLAAKVLHEMKSQWDRLLHTSAWKHPVTQCHSKRTQTKRRGITDNQLLMMNRWWQSNRLVSGVVLLSTVFA